MLYAEASALVKLVVEEAESELLRRLLADSAPVCSSVVAAVEVSSAAGRRVGERGVELTEIALQAISWLELESAVVGDARRRVGLRALDAIHLASALSLGSDLEGLVTYDRRLAEAAREAGLDVLAPA